MRVTAQDIKAARQNISPSINITPCESSKSASQLIGTDVYFKLENLQRTGSFKIRGATNKILSLTESEKKQGVIACSAGNHAQGVALSATNNGVKSTIFMPENAPIAKIEATRGYGAQVMIKGANFDEAKEHAYAYAKEHNLVFVHPYEDEKVIAGQGTIGFELLEQVRDLESIVIPIGGGGLISGIAIAAKEINPQIKIIGVQTELYNSMKRLYSKEASAPSVESKAILSTLADGIAIKQPSQNMYDSFISKYVDNVVTVNEDQISEAIVYLLERAKTVAEGSGAVSLAAAMNYDLKLGSKTALIISGGNIDMNIVSAVIQRGQLSRGRLCEFSVIVPDIPGSLSRLTQILAEQKANILSVSHDRIRQGLNIKETKIDFVLETISLDHIEKIKQALMKSGAKVI